MDNFQFEKILKQAQDAYPDVNVTRDMVNLFMSKFFELRRDNDKKPRSEREIFPMLIRHALNECKIIGERRRDAYGSLIGFHFGPAARRASAGRRKAGLPPKSELPGAVPVDRSKKQLAWRF